MSQKIYEETLAEYFSLFLKLPWTGNSIPGQIVEQIVALVNTAEVLNTYDFVDVVKRNDTGWQVKSTKESTPVTWKRAKIENKEELIRKSHESTEGMKQLGEAIINFCNNHVKKSIERYNLKKINYARCIIFENRSVKYFERELCSLSRPSLFDPDDFYWDWSREKETIRKEQLSALHGFSKQTNKKVWAWHGLGENQLHFSGERSWWNDGNNLIEITIDNPPPRFSYQDFFDALKNDS